MAEKLDDHVFHGRGRQTVYRWDEWLDGSVWQFEQGKDFHCLPPSFWSAARHAAKKRGLKIRVSGVTTSTPVIQAYRDET